jgi:DNA polymerase I-like protein with 3'-5' exonuclease and polymerase domains
MRLDDPPGLFPDLPMSQRPLSPNKPPPKPKKVTASPRKKEPPGPPPESNWSPITELPNLSAAKEVAFDLETHDIRLGEGKGPGWFDRNGKVVGVALAWDGGQAYLPVDHPRSPNLDHGGVGRYIKDLFRQTGTHFIAHNASYDVGWLKAEWGIEPPAILDDTMAMAALADENQREFGLDALCRSHGLPGKDETLLREAVRAFVRDRKPLSSPGAYLYQLEARFVGPYAEADVTSTLGLYRALKPTLEAEETYAAYRLEADLIPLTVEMRRRGIRIDALGIHRAKETLIAKLNILLVEIGRRLERNTSVTITDLRSPGWMNTTLRGLGITPPQTAKNNPSFESSWLKVHPHPVLPLIARAKQLNEAHDKFLTKYLEDYAWKGRIHATVNQYRSEEGGTRSHRMSYSDPPLQQIPSRDADIAPLIRSIFLPEDGEIWSANDYNQQEFRLIVNTAETIARWPRSRLDQVAMKIGINWSNRMFLRNRDTLFEGAIEAGDAYRNDPNTDFHEWVAKITHLERRRAKDVNFAKAYGAGIAQFASMTGMSQAEAEDTMKVYDDRLPFVNAASWIVCGLASKEGFTRLIDGARCHYPRWEGEGRWRPEDVEKFEKDYLAANPGVKIVPKELDCSPRATREEVERLIRYRKINGDPADHPWYGQPRHAFAYKAFNHRIQGSAARMTKRAMLECWRAGIVPMIQMHDELGFSVSSPETAERAAEIMRNAVPTLVPMKVDVEYGRSWGLAKNASWDAAKK